MVVIFTDELAVSRIGIRILGWFCNPFPGPGTESSFARPRTESSLARPRAERPSRYTTISDVTQQLLYVCLRVLTFAQRSSFFIDVRRWNCGVVGQAAWRSLARPCAELLSLVSQVSVKYFVSKDRLQTLHEVIVPRWKATSFPWSENVEFEI